MSARDVAYANYWPSTSEDTSVYGIWCAAWAACLEAQPNHWNARAPVRSLEDVLAEAERPAPTEASTSPELIAEVREDKRLGKMFIATLGDADLEPGMKLYAMKRLDATEASTSLSPGAPEPNSKES